MAFVISSPVFTDGGYIPARYTGDGADISPPLAWSGVPQGTASLALIVHDPDAARPGGFTHWGIFNLPADLDGLPEGVARRDRLENGAVQGKNDGGDIGYMGPLPPPGKAHHYHFTLYALSRPLNLSRGASRQQALVVMQGHILEETELVGLYQR